MATKQTLKSLFGSVGDEREQVSLNLGQVGLQSTVNPSSGYSVFARETPKTNAALQVADSIKGLTGIAREYARIQKGIGEEAKADALAFEGDILEELKKTSPDTFFTYKRQKAFREVLTKRAINEELLPQLKEDADSFLDFDKYKELGEVESAMDEYLTGKWDEFSGSIGDNIASDQGTGALWNLVTNEWKDGIRTDFIKNQDSFTASGIGDETSLLLDVDFKKQYDDNGDVMNVDVSNIQTRMNALEENLLEAGINDAALRKKTIQNVFISKVDKMVQLGNYNDAKSVLQNLQKMKVNGKDMFRGTDIGKLVTDYYVKIQKGIQDVDKNTNENSVKLYSSNVVQNSQVLTASRKFEDLSPNQIATIHKTLETLNPQITQEQTEELIKTELFNDQNGSPNTKYFQLLERLSFEGDESAQTIHTLARPKFKTAISEQDVVVSAVRRTPEDEQRLLNDYQTAWFNTKAEERVEPDQFARANGFTPFEKLRGLKKTLTRGDYIQNVSSYKDVEGDIEDLFDKVTFGDLIMRQNFEDGAVIRIQNELEEFARDLVSPDGDDDNLTEEQARALFENRRDKINTKANELRARELARYKSLVKAANTGIVKTDMTGLTDDEITAIDDTDSGGYASLKNWRMFGWFRDAPSIEADRKEMVKNADDERLRKSLERHGFEKYSPENAEYMSLARFDAADILLFQDADDMTATEDEWFNVLQKQFLQKELTAEDKKILSQASAYGVIDLGTLDQFMTAQDFLMKQEQPAFPD
tara:strand:- start:1354 stop:3636 length:2283 start_codon:yes stop_codon:yes gene_type:complete